MKKRGKGLSIKINLTNRWLYTLIAIGVLVIASVGIYALTPGIKPNPGHLASEMAPPSPCSSGQFLKFDGTNWVCGSDTDTDYCAGGTCPGSLNVQGPLTASGGKIVVYQLSPGCIGTSTILLTTSPTCYTIKGCGGNSNVYYACNGNCGTSSFCTNTLVGYLV